MRATLLASILVTVLLGLPAGFAQASGTLAICDEAHLLEAVAGGGTVTFGCSGAIALAGTITITADTTIDGSGQAITISGSDAARVFLVDRGATLNLNAVTVAHGYAGQDRGGAVLNRGTLNVSNSTFADNSALLGAAIFNEAGTLRVSDSTFSGNSGGTGGAIWSTGGTVAVSNSTFAGNSATGPGGAIRNWSAAVTIVNSTFSGNSAGGLGGAAIYTSGGALTLSNTVLADSVAGGNCYGAVIDGGGNVSYPDTTCPGANGNPRLGPLQDNGGPTRTMALGPGSSALNRGDDAICAGGPVEGLDQRGVSRPQGSHCDSGAYEALEPFLTDLVVDLQPEGGNVLTWTHLGDRIDHYEVYRAEKQFFGLNDVGVTRLPDVAPPAQGATASTTDPAPPLGAGTSYFYLVLPVGQAGVYPPSNRAGVFNFSFATTVD